MTKPNLAIFVRMRHVLLRARVMSVDPHGWLKLFHTAPATWLNRIVSFDP